MKFYNRFSHNFKFVFLLLTTALTLSYAGILLLRPCGVHQWRQTDCLSIATNFYERGMHFFGPEIHCLISDGLTTGMTAGECPITYYFVASLWKIFGKHEWIYRLFTMILFLTGVFCFYKTLVKIHRDFFWNALFALSLLTSPILVYYGSGFLADIHALSLVFVASYFMMLYGTVAKPKHLVLALGFFAVAGLIKITALLLFLTFFGLFLLELVGVKLWRDRKIFVHKVLGFMLFFAMIVLVTLWYVYAAYYNDWHEGKYTFNDIWPIWEAGGKRIKVIVESLRSIMIYQVFPKTWIYALVVMVLVLLMNLKRIPKLLTLGLAILSVGCVLYMILWFDAFDIHDYYVTNLFVLPAAITVSFYYFITKYWSFAMQLKHVKVISGLCILWGIFYASSNISLRLFPKENRLYLTTGSQPEVDLYKYTNWHYQLNIKALESIEPFLEGIGVAKDDLVITQPDPSFCINLYLMNRRGWSAMGVDANTSEGMWKRIYRGAKFLVVTDENVAAEKPFLAEFMTHEIGTYQNVVVFDLRPFSKQ